MTTTPVRLQRSRAKGSKLTSPNGLPVVCVSRPGKWGNPFKVGVPSPLTGEPMTAGYAAGMFSLCVSEFPVPQSRIDAWAAHGGSTLMLVALAGRVAEVLAPIRGKNLACWCKPGGACHADTLLVLANDQRRPR